MKVRRRVCESPCPSLLFRNLDLKFRRVMRIVLATVCYRFGSRGLVIKLNFCSDFEHKYVLVKILMLKFRQDLKLEFGQYFAAYVLKRL